MQQPQQLQQATTVNLITPSYTQQEIENEVTSTLKRDEEKEQAEKAAEKEQVTKKK